PGTSLVASTSARLIAESGCASSATTTTVLPATSAGATTRTSPSRLAEPCGATIATTPVGSGTERLKNGPATGLPAPATCTNLSAQPAYQTQVSIAASTWRPASAGETPSDAAISCTNCSRRPSSTAATR